jgi:hypothetical protein
MNGGTGGGGGAGRGGGDAGGGDAAAAAAAAAGLEDRIRRALACPCVARFVGPGGVDAAAAGGGGGSGGGGKSGAAAAAAGGSECSTDPDRPCGRALADAFACYHRSEAVPKGNDCLPLALAAADCLAEHPHSVLRPPEAPPQGEAAAGVGDGAGGQSQGRRYFS